MGRVYGIALVLLVVVLAAGSGCGARPVLSGQPAVQLPVTEMAQASCTDTEVVDASSPEVVETSGLQVCDLPPSIPPHSPQDLTSHLSGQQGEVSQALFPPMEVGPHIPVHELPLDMLSDMPVGITPGYLPDGYCVQRVFVLPPLGPDPGLAVLLLISNEPISQEKVDNIDQLYSGIAETGLVRREGQAKIVVRLVLPFKATGLIETLIDLAGGRLAYLDEKDVVTTVERLNGESVYYHGILPYYTALWYSPGCHGVIQAYKDCVTRDEALEMARSMPILHENSASQLHDFLVEECQRG